MGLNKILNSYKTIGCIMWKFYQYTFYWLYTWQKKLWGESDLPEFTAIIGMSMSLLALIGSLFGILIIFFEIPPIEQLISKLELLILTGIILIVHYLIFIRGGTYVKLEETFKVESKKIRRKRGRFVVIYIFGSISLFLILLFVIAWLSNKGFV